MSTNDPITALLDHFDGKSIATEHVEKWRKALAPLQDRGPMDKRLDAFAKLLGIEQGKAGAPRKVTPHTMRARRVDALIALSRLPAKKGNREARLSEIARHFDVDVDELESWTKNKELRRLAAEHVATAGEYLKRFEASLARERASKKSARTLRIRST